MTQERTFTVTYNGTDEAVISALTNNAITLTIGADAGAPGSIEEEGETETKIEITVEVEVETGNESPEPPTVEARTGSVEEEMEVVNSLATSRASGVVLDFWSDDNPNNGLPTFEIDAEGTMHCYIFGAIGSWWGMVDAGAFVRALRSSGNAKAVRMYVNSPGGSVNDTLFINGILAGANLASLEVFYFSTCASAATFIGAVKGAKLKADKNAMFMIHRGMGEPGWVNARAAREAASFLEKNDALIFGNYAERSGKPVDELLAMVDATETGQLWLTANEALALGLIDEIESGMLPQFKVAASLDPKYNLAPPAKVKESVSPINQIPTMEDTTKSGGFNLRAFLGLAPAKDPGDEDPNMKELNAIKGEVQAVLSKSAAQEAELSKLKAELEAEKASKEAVIAKAEEAIRMHSVPPVPPVQDLQLKSQVVNVAEITTMEDRALAEFHNLLQK